MCVVYFNIVPVHLAHNTFIQPVLISLVNVFMILTEVHLAHNTFIQPVLTSLVNVLMISTEPNLKKVSYNNVCSLF